MTSRPAIDESETGTTTRAREEEAQPPRTPVNGVLAAWVRAAEWRAAARPAAETEER